MLAFILGLPALYLGAAVVLGHITVNRDWHPPASGITIYIETNGIHTGIVVPASAPGWDWHDRVRPGDLRGYRDSGNRDRAPWLAFGWGDRDFYLHTARWSEVRLSTGARAFAGLGTTLLHVDHLRATPTGPDFRAIRLTQAQYLQVARFIDASFADWREILPGYGDDDNFYAARGSYSALRTCNVWTADALKSAGVASILWDPFPNGVMRQ